MKVRQWRVLAEAEDAFIGALLRKSSELAMVYEVDIFLSDTANDGMMVLYKQHRWEEGLKPITLKEAPLPRDLNYYVQTIKSHLSEEKKSLWFGLDSKLPDYLLELHPDEASSSTIDDYPAIAALGFAVTY